MGEVSRLLDDPLFGCLRPGSARGIPPALMHPAFGEFLDLAENIALDSETCDSVMRMIDKMRQHQLLLGSRAPCWVWEA